MAVKTLTARAVQTLKLPAGSSSVVVWDLAVPGLGVKKGRSGTRWVMRLQVDGKRTIQTFGKFPAIGLAEAREHVAKAREALEAGEPLVNNKLEGIADAGTRKAVRLTCDAAFDRYFEQHVEPNLARPKAVRQHWQRDLSPLIGGAVLARLTRADVMRVSDELNRTKPAATAAAGLRLFRAYLNWTADRELSAPGIAMRLRVKSVPSRDRVLSIGEIQSVLTAAEKLGVRPGHVVRLLWLTACRAGEIAGLTWSEVDLDNRLITLGAERTKTSESRLVYLSDAAAAVLEQAKEFSDGDFVFAAINAAGQPFAPYTLSRQIRKELNWSDFRVHDIRRSAASALATAGFSQEVVKLVLGHVSGSVFSGATAAYIKRQAYEKQVRDAVATLAKLVE